MVKIEQTGGRLTEEEILHGKEDAYGIYQVNRKGAGRDYAFLSFDSLRSKGKVPERTEYQLVQAKEEVNKPFEKENELRSVQERLTKINAELDMKPKEEPKKMIKKEELKKCL